MDYFLIYLIFINVVSLLVVYEDKQAAANDDWRISEAVLFLLVALGGGIMMFITMLFIRHKIRKIKFMLGIPIIVLAQIWLLWWGISNFDKIF